MQEQRGNIGKEMETLKRYQQEKLEIKNTVREMQHALGSPINRPDRAKERISELEAMSVEFPTLKSEGENEKVLQNTQTEEPLERV